LHFNAKLEMIDGDCVVDETIFPRQTNGHKRVWELKVPTSRAT
jgi:hypothetical protein